MKVTGPKTDIWLVKTVSVLLIPISICLLCALYFKLQPLPVILIAATTSAGLASIDFYYTVNRTIKWVYAIDGVLESIFFFIWIFLLVRTITSARFNVKS